MAEAQEKEPEVTPPPKTFSSESSEILKGVEESIRKGESELEASRQRSADIAKRYQPELEKRQAAIDTELQRQQANQPEVPTVPVSPPVPTREQYINQTAAKSLFTVASVIGAIGMLGGRGRGMLAMSGLTGAIQGFRENNAEKYKAGMEQYHAQVNEQTKAYDEAYKHYLAILQSNRLTLEQKMELYELSARSMNDELAIEIATRKDPNEAIKHAVELGKLSGELKKVDAETQLFPYKLQEQQLKLKQAGLEVDKIRAEIDKLKLAPGKTDTNSRMAANELVTRLQAQSKQLDKEITAAKKWFSGYSNEQVQEMKDQKAALDAQIDAGLKDLQSYTGAAPETTPKPSAGGKLPPGYMRIKNKKTGEIVGYPIGETPDGWSRIQ